jgi:hypothetical protein
VVVRGAIARRIHQPLLRSGSNAFIGCETDLCVSTASVQLQHGHALRRSSIQLCTFVWRALQQN